VDIENLALRGHVTTFTIYIGILVLAFLTNQSICIRRYHHGIMAVITNEEYRFVDYVDSLSCPLIVTGDYKTKSALHGIVIPGYQSSPLSQRPEFRSNSKFIDGRYENPAFNSAI